MLPFSSLASCIISIIFKFFSSFSQSSSSLVILKMHLVTYSFCSLFMIEVVRMNKSEITNPWRLLSVTNKSSRLCSSLSSCSLSYKKIVLSYKKFVYFWQNSHLHENHAQL